MKKMFITERSIEGTEWWAFREEWWTFNKE